MITSGNSAFWREVLDFVPNLTLLFRIEDEENAHLIFANQEIQHQLLYRPQDYVLEGESDTIVKKDLDKLIDRIADLSYRKQRDKGIYCQLHDRQGNVLIYTFDFRIFKTRVGKTSLILVTLVPEGGRVQKSESGLMAARPKATEEKVWKSEVMQAILDKIPEYRLQGSNLLVHGEEGTGRQTLARYLAEHLSTSSDEIFVIQLEKSDEKQHMQLFGDENLASILTGSKGETPGWFQSPIICVVISDLAELSEKNIRLLADRIRQRNERKYRTRIIAISGAPFEKIVDRLGSLYYELNFYPILMPGLKHRKEDVRIIARAWLNRAAEAIGLENISVPDKELNKLEEYDWPGNFPELFRVLRQALLSVDDGGVHIRIWQPDVVNAGRKSSEIIPFDDMNRRYLKTVLELTKGKIYGKEGAARLLGLKPTTLQSKLKKLNVK